MESSKIDIDKYIKELQEALLQVDRIQVFKIIEKYYTINGNFKDVEYMIIKVLESIGQGWEHGKYSLSQVYMSGIICEELINKYIAELNVENKSEYKIAIGVLQDYHSLGKRIVYSILSASGYEIIDFGQGLEVDELVKLTIDNKIDFLLISVLMISSALEVEKVVDKLKKENTEIKVIVGGAPFRLDESLCKKVNADAYGNTASDVINIIKKLEEGGKYNEFYAKSNESN